jgi:hypothetical protein
MRTLTVFACLSAGVCLAQYPGLTLPASGNNQRASVSQMIGPVKVSIEYSSPKVHGPNGADRRGKIWGELVPYGMTNQGFGTAVESPWRAGANENTIFAVSEPVLIEGKLLPAGKYGFHIMTGKEEWTLIFSKNNSSWGSFFYEPKEDALRVTVKPKKHDYREYLTYEFTTREPAKAVAEMQWEDLAVAWTIEVDNIEDRYISKLQDELRTSTGFNYVAFVSAAQYTLQAKKHLELGLEWAEAAINRPFVGQKTFQTVSTKAQVLLAMNRTQDAKNVMNEAIATTNPTTLQIHQLGRMLQNAGMQKEALEVFQTNQQKNGDVWPVHVGLARGYMGVGDNTKALEHAKKALEQAPDQINKTNLAAMVKALSEGKKFSN